MNDYEALYRTVCANPNDDVPRLVLADWLQEHGEDDRAEFIRVQCRSAKALPEDPRWRDERRRQRELLNRSQGTWVPANLPGSDWVFRRGFIELLKLHAEEYLQVCTQLYDIIPLRVVRLDRSHAFGERIADSPSLARLTGLDLAGQHINSAGLLPFCESRHLGNLASLDLSSNPLREDGLQRLAQSCTFANLRELILTDNGRLGYAVSIHAAGAAAIANSPHLKRLERLELGGQVIGDGGLRAIVESENPRSLRVLDVSSNDIGAIGTAGVEALVASDNLSSLVVLDLSDNEIGTAGAKELAEWPGPLAVDRIAVTPLPDHRQWRACPARFPVPHRRVGHRAAREPTERPVEIPHEVAPMAPGIGTPRCRCGTFPL